MRHSRNSDSPLAEFAFNQIFNEHMLYVSELRDFRPSLQRDDSDLDVAMGDRPDR
jgi:hypothetical protein